MVKIYEILFCDGCGVEILLAPVVQEQREYCCEDCAQVLPCHCGERLELDEQRRASTGIPDITARDIS
jgi:hypothetical protein